MKPRMTIVVGAGGVGKTTVAAALAARRAEAGERTLVMTFDPSMRLKDTLGIDEGAAAAPVQVRDRLWASLLDPKRTFDALIARYAPDDEARRRIENNRYYRDLSGELAGILEYMAVEKLFEVREEGGFDRIVLDTPPTRQALDFLEAPERIVGFLDSGVAQLAGREWFDEAGRLKAGKRFGPLGRGLEKWLDHVVGLQLLRDVAEFFQAFGPLFAGFRERAEQVGELLRDEATRFVLVAGPGEERIPDAMFFARQLAEASYRLDSVVVNRVHPPVAAGTVERLEGPAREAARLFAWLGERDRRGLERLGELLSEHELVALPLEPSAPTDLEGLRALPLPDELG